MTFDFLSECVNCSALRISHHVPVFLQRSARISVANLALNMSERNCVDSDIVGAVVAGRSPDTGPSTLSARANFSSPKCFCCAASGSRARLALNLGSCGIYQWGFESGRGQVSEMWFRGAETSSA